MSRIRAKNTRPEIMVRSILHRLGFRFRLKKDSLPCNPDIVLSSRKVAIFVHGCFWHRHKNCKDATTPKSRTDFWELKFETNLKRDRKKSAALRKLGWKVVVVWECEVCENPRRLAQKLCSLLQAKKKQEVLLYLPTARELMQVAEIKAEYIVKPTSKSSSKIRL